MQVLPRQTQKRWNEHVEAKVYQQDVCSEEEETQCVVLKTKMY